ncbi:flagellar protein FlgN [Bacillus songklensis]|uniref:Flagellar protein FlgN n=1 Tax=Bacillus songklensis TaxID=1069116 RepID=A0ABV8BBL5_9BACI
MQAEKLREILTKQLTVHKSLLAIAERKTDIIKKGDLQSLNEILKHEQAHIALISQLERERNEETVKLLSGHPIQGEQPTLSDVIEAVHSTEKEPLRSLQTELVACIQSLKERNELNQQLIYQSMQFVNLTMDLIRPQPKNFNYEKPKRPINAVKSHSMFNSKA